MTAQAKGEPPRQRSSPTSTRSWSAPGPAGLASAACLKQQGIDAVVLEAGPDLATSWRNHYLRLHLHTVKHIRSLPGLAFAREVPRYPSRAQVVAYLERTPRTSAIAPRTDEPVRRIRAQGDRPAGGQRARPLPRAAWWWWRRGTTGWRIPIGCPIRNASAARSCTPGSTATARASPGGACWWSAPATPARRSRSICWSTAPPRPCRCGRR